MSPKQFVLALLLLISLKSTLATIYQIDDRSYEVPGANKYANELNSHYQICILSEATQAVLKTFNQKEGKGKKYDRVTLLIESFTQDRHAVASTKDNLIRLNADYLQRHRGDIREEFAGVVYHEMTHVWQWTGNSMAPTGLINGIADYVRLKGGYASKGWPRKGSGSRWDDGYAVTAYFLEYCNDLKHGFVAELNALMKYSYSEAFFVQLLGKPVHELWHDYKLAYGTTRIPGSEEGYRKPLAHKPHQQIHSIEARICAEAQCQLEPMENHYDSSRAELTGAALRANNFQQKNVAGSSKDLVKNLGSCNGVGSCFLAKVSAMNEKIGALIPYIKSRKLGMNSKHATHW